MASEAKPFCIEATEPGSWAISNMLSAAKFVHEAMRRADPLVRRSMLRQAQNDIAKAVVGLNDALALCESMLAARASDTPLKEPDSE